MNVHKNARLTPSGRALLSDRVACGWTVKAASAAARVCEIEALRRERLTGAAIAGRLGMARSTVGLVLRRLSPGRLANFVKPGVTLRVAPRQLRVFPL